MPAFPSWDPELYKWGMGTEQQGTFVTLLPDYGNSVTSCFKLLPPRAPHHDRLYRDVGAKANVYFYYSKWERNQDIWHPSIFLKTPITWEQALLLSLDPSLKVRCIVTKTFTAAPVSSPV